ncbi:MAG: sulfotransferase domain-containing protein [Anaerolineae bacterium]|nr:sulfotransferase domain-containing protein [Anaerolineae bacterium]
MAKITWLASFPKSGNTWMRVFLTNYWRDADTPADINDLEDTPIASARALFDEALGVDSGDLTVEEIDALRPAVYRQFAADLDQMGYEERFCKIHDAYTVLPNGEPFFPPDVTARAIYILRNPLDLAVSYANHMHSTLAEAVKRMSSADHRLAYSRTGLSHQVHQHLLTWSGHVTSWMSVTAFPVHLVRYEDMIADPFSAFAGVVRFIDERAAADGIDEARLEKAIRFSAFEELQRQEKERGFREKMARSESFFRKGKVGTWREKLTDDLVAQIVHDHHQVMQKYGYLTEDGRLVY